MRSWLRTAPFSATTMTPSTSGAARPALAALPSGDTISTEKVKSIVTDRAGVSGTFRELKLERDDGRTVYEGEMRSGRTDYEFTIDAYTGAVLEWDTDWDD